MDVSNYLGLVGVAVILAITPGPDTLLTLQYALRKRSAGLFAALGAGSGIFVWAALVAAGVAAFLQDSPLAFHTLRVLGGTYLFYLGYRTLTTHTRPDARNRARTPVTVSASDGVQKSPTTTVSDDDSAAILSDPDPRDLQPRNIAPSTWSAFSAGVLCCLTNPKTGLFFLALIPQFTPTDAAPLYVVTVIGGTVAATIGGYLAIIALGAHTTGTWLNRPAVTHWIHRLSGAVFIALGLMTIIPVITALLQP